MGWQVFPDEHFVTGPALTRDRWTHLALVVTARPDGNHAAELFVDGTSVDRLPSAPDLVRAPNEVRFICGNADFDVDELMEIGERRLNMLRAFNAREGIGRREDRLPGKLFRPLTGTGPTAGVALDRAEIEGALDEYYRLAGWDDHTGNPTPDTLARLGLEWAV